ncbi:MAG: ATP-dependent Clp protease proteolytic subunit, partial [Fibrobacteria bacterium]|nr:ATP-dependent Clp protease proteolytic subunit [Fibrobacteria bacterium]
AQDISIGSLLKPDSSMIMPPHRKTAVVISIEEQIDPGLTYFLKRAIAEAKSQNPDIIIFKINTFGGRLDAAFEIVDLITSIKTCSTYAYVQEKAISAGALISLACNRIVMNEGTTIGDCAPIIQSQEGIKMAGEKIESPLRAKFRNLAEKNGYPSLLAQSMVSIDMHIYKAMKNNKTIYLTGQEWDDLDEKSRKEYKNKKTVVAKGQLLTITDTEAEEYGFSIGSFSSINDFMTSHNLEAEENIVSNWSEDLVRTIGKFAPILMLLGFGALYMEFKTPGFGIFGIIGISCLLIVFGSKYMSGLANHTELLLLLGGATLIFVEIYLMPGTLIFGGLGLALIIVSLILSMQAFTIPDPNLPWEKDILMNNILLVLGIAVASLIIPVLSVKFILPHLPGSFQVVSTATMQNAHVASIQESHPEIIPGTPGKSTTMLRPAGKILLNNRRYEASAFSGFIEPDKPVEVVSISGNKIIVKEISS